MSTIAQDQWYLYVAGRPHRCCLVSCKTKKLAESDAGGKFAGMFRGNHSGQQPISKPDEDGQFEVVYRIRDFTLDPCVRDREKEYAIRPDDLVLNCAWAFTHSGGPSGQEVTDVESVSPNKEEK